MYLKSIEVQGFKSFANKIVFKFENGITGIVGPNGSGKSNVADAVRWVLGEQRIKQLRGASMQDVIFSGTELRKPLSYAFVAITLDNSDHQLAIDYEEVTIARRIYRSGESEYLINGTVCRLKDVNELFYDTGIGKEGYSIIGQGQIDKILSGKPEERRELFDEAAGIVKFKRRKDAAQKRLENEEGNLVRVKDILAELEKQVGPLEKQSETAKLYLKKKEELKSLDVNVFLLENERLNGQLKTVSDKIEIATTDYDDTQSKYDRIKEEYEKVESKVEELNTKIDLAKNKLSESSVLREKLEGEILVIREQIKAAALSKDDLTRRLGVINEDISSREKTRQTVEAQKTEDDKLMTSLLESKAEASGLLSEVLAKIVSLNENIENNKNTIISELNKRATIKTDIGKFDTMKEQYAIKKSELNSRLLKAKSDEQQQDKVIKDLEKECEKIADKIKEMNEDLAAKEAVVEGIREKIASNDKELRDTQVIYHQDKSKLEALTNLTERYEGYGGSVKKVMEQKDNTKGIIGVVADIIKVEARYETAIETALGGNIQNIVTDNENTAKKMIGFLKTNKLGRATFLPLTSITNPQEFKTPEVLNEKGVIGMADSLVSCDSKYSDVPKAMLGRIVVVDNVDNAVIIAKKYDYGIRMVTLEGELLVPGGAISGGAFKNNSNLLGRRREIEELEKKIAAGKKKMDDLLADIEKLKSERNSNRMKIEEQKVSIQRLYIEQNTAQINVDNAYEKKNEVIKGTNDIAGEEIDIEKKLKEIEDDKARSNDELLKSEELEKQLTKDIEVYQKELDANRAKEADYSVEVSKWDLEVSKMEQKQEFVNQNLMRIIDEIKRYEIDAKEIQDKIKSEDEDTNRKLDNIKEIETTILEGDNSKDQQQTQLSLDIELRDKLSEDQKNFFTTRDELSKKLGELDKELFRLNSQKEKFEESIESFINYMWTEYEITLTDASSLRNELLTDLSAMKKQIVQVKDQIKKLGPVNVSAIEDYKALMERYTFLKEQHDDLVAATKTLSDIIAELDDQMRKQFAESFKDINTEFDKVFKELFGGGKGSLELIEDEDILEAGIRIIAQPPGKKLQNMMQLSGGEKALTAIALLFAIQNLKPSPFCLLDEIEAALDESNVDRFAKYLHKLTKNTQFIVITHRRGTMDKCDRLYGITMQEKGVSALVSVNLIDKDLDD